jgi:hypothetical protein
MDFSDAVVLEINKHIEYLAKNVADGSAKSFEDYKFVCGQIQGLMVARRITQDLAKRLKDQDDD